MGKADRPRRKVGVCLGERMEQIRAHRLAGDVRCFVIKSPFIKHHFPIQNLFGNSHS